MIDRITDDIYWVGVNDHQTDLFEALWPLPKGISYNSYLIADDKTALIDGVPAEYLATQQEKIHAVIAGDRPIDYMVINHMEPDHTGSLKLLRRLYPDMTIVGNSKTADMLNRYYGITENIMVVDDGDRLQLGRHELLFTLTPMVHWPETMMTFDTTARVLFSGDAFGSFGTVDEALFDDELPEGSNTDEFLRYFANIIGRYSSMVQNALGRVHELDCAVIASTHGMIWRKQPERILKLYERWNRHDTEAGVVIAYASMYGNTQKVVEVVGRALAARGIPVTVHNLSHSHASFALQDIWRYSAVVLGCPTYNTGLFPAVDDLVRLIENKLIPNRTMGIVSSFGWAGGAEKILKKFAGNNKWQLTEPAVVFQGAPHADTLEQAEQLAGNIAESIR